MQILTKYFHDYLKVITILCLCALTLTFFHCYRRYVATGENLLINSNFKNNLKGWEYLQNNTSVITDDHSVRLNSPNKKEVVYFRQKIENVKNGSLLEFSGKIKIKGVERGEKKWQRVNFEVVALDAKGRPLYSEPHFFVSLSGTADWEQYRHVFKVNDNMRVLLLGVQLTMVKGTVWVKDISLVPVSEKPGYKIYWYVGVSTWLILLAWILIDFYRTHSFSYKMLPLASALIVVAIGILMPLDILTHISSYILHHVPGLSDAMPLAEQAGFEGMYTVFHFSGFVILALIVSCYSSTLRHLAKNFSLLVLLAMVTEVLQLFAAGRKTELSDLAADTSGILVALVLWLIWQSVRQTINRK